MERECFLAWRMRVGVFVDSDLLGLEMIWKEAALLVDDYPNDVF